MQCNSSIIYPASQLLYELIHAPESASELYKESFIFKASLKISSLERSLNKKLDYLAEKISSLWTQKYTLVFIFLLFTGTSLQAFNQRDYVKVREGQDCSDCDLRGAIFSSQDLYGVDLSGADLRRAAFIGTNLRTANLEGANIRGTNFSGAKLGRTVWVDGKRCAARAVGRCFNKR